MFKHLEENKIDYVSHYIRGLRFAWWSMKMYVVCLVHAVFPNVFSDTFSKSVLKLAKELEKEDAKY